MILLDAVHINHGGGKVLLDFLIQELELSKKKVFYLFDSRIKNNLPNISKSNNIVFVKGNIYQRDKFYRQNANKFTSIFCFGNLPPYKRYNAMVFTYFHQPMFLEIPKDCAIKEKILLNIKMGIFRFIKDNTDFWMAQTPLIKFRLKEKYNINEDHIKICPFYPKLQSNPSILRERGSYLYVSNATYNKNHKRLIDAFCVFYDKHNMGKLIITVSNEYPEIVKVIESKKKLGYPIVNLGFVNREDLSQIYQMSEYLIFPSLAESFGLGIVEAIDLGCNVIGADLPYMHAVCEPSILFDPYDVDSIEKAFEESLDPPPKKSINLINSNNIFQVISLLY